MRNHELNQKEISALNRAMRKLGMRLPLTEKEAEESWEEFKASEREIQMPDFSALDEHRSVTLDDLFPANVETFEGMSMAARQGESSIPESILDKMKKDKEEARKKDE